MNPNDVIESYVVDVMRRVPRKERDGIGLELRGLLDEMLADKAQAEGKPADDSMVLAMLRGFGTPAEVAARYRPPGVVIIPAEQTRAYALTSIIGVALQWAMTLPAVFEGERFSTWWLTWGLGSLWWPGFLMMTALVAAGLRHTGLFKSAWKPRMVDPERVNRGALAFAIGWIVIGITFMVSLPWIVDRLPGVLPQVLAFDADFLRQRAWPVVVLWLCSLATLSVVLYQGRWSPFMRRLEIAFNLGFIALLGWWLAADDMFQAKATNDGARACLVLVMVIMLADLAYRLYRQRTRIRAPELAN